MLLIETIMRSIEKKGRHNSKVNLKEKRKCVGMTQSEVAKAVGISRAFYTNIENGKRLYSVETAKKIAKVLGFDWTSFFEGGHEANGLHTDKL